MSTVEQAYTEEISTLPNKLQAQRIKLRDKLKASKLLNELQEDEVYIKYYGSSDSGSIEETSLDDKHLLKNEVTEFLYDVLWTRHSGYENNDGGAGEVRWNFITDIITIDHDQHFMDSKNYVTKF